MFHDFCQSVTLVFCQRTHVSHDHHPRGPCCSRARISYDAPGMGAISYQKIFASALMVRELHRELARAGFQGDAFGWVHRAYPEWTRTRWDHAVAELATAQQGWQRANALNCLSDFTGVGDSLGGLVASTADGNEMG